MYDLLRPVHTSRFSFRLCLILWLFAVAQIAETFHLIEHTATGQNDGCEICSTAVRFGSTLLPEPVHIALPSALVQYVSGRISNHFYLYTSSVYASRAPPALG